VQVKSASTNIPVYLAMIVKIPTVMTAALIALLAWVTITQPYNNSPPIRSDGAGYHVWVYGFKNLDFTFCKYKELLDPTESISFVNKDKNVCGVKYPSGVGLFQYPFVAYWTIDDARLGYSNGEHLAVLWLGAALLLLTSFFSFKTLKLLGCSPLISLVAIGSFIFGSGLFHYSTYDASFSHIYSAFGTSALLWLAIRSKTIGWSFSSIVFFGLLVFWLYMVRQTNGAITLAVVILISNSLKNNMYKIQSLLVWASATAGGILVQFAYNYYVTGEIRISSYGQEEFVDIGKYFYNVLLSYERGLITYYPVYLFTVLLAACVWRSLVTYGFIALIIIFTILYGSWHSWFLGGGMGHRGFVELAPFGILVLGMSLNQLNKEKLVVLIPVLIVCCYITTMVMIGYWRGTFPFTGATASTYWSHLLPFFIK
jgi:hypothetical protein